MLTVGAGVGVGLGVGLPKLLGRLLAHPVNSRGNARQDNSATGLRKWDESQRARNCCICILVSIARAEGSGDKPR